MVALPFLSLALSVSPPRLPHQHRSIFSVETQSSCRFFISPRHSRSHHLLLLPYCSSNNGGNMDESRFLDVDGVVQDMDGYLNYLSLEYDSVWDTKPSWCQPWTIVLTGITVTVSSWVLLHSAIISTVVFSLVSAWWFIYLYAYPKAYTHMIAEQRKNVTASFEDAFGTRREP